MYTVFMKWPTDGNYERDTIEQTTEQDPYVRRWSRPKSVHWT